MNPGLRLLAALATMASHAATPTTADFTCMREQRVALGGLGQFNHILVGDDTSWGSEHGERFHHLTV